MRLSSGDPAFIFRIRRLRCAYGPQQTDIAGNLFAKAALRDLNHDRARGGSALQNVVESAKSISVALRARSRARPARWHQEGPDHGTASSELNGTTFHSLHRHGNVTMPGDEDDWIPCWPRRGRAELATTSPRQSHVEH